MDIKFKSGVKIGNTIGETFKYWVARCTIVARYTINPFSMVSGMQFY